ncbi:NADP-dependent oxidoreductase [Actinomadura harenae]|uniref:NADP-dependent oxidoreductase n=1 Tax=Actinomadura harenae TaxID=2483351 RepID=A0A3M2L144_9ACTN|nr:NADP-dependent oxidoreductase [Actinomadura harenae]RMI30450.1 NADP-dependent oxidoreductase [Actinomadura harenae]
MKAVVATDYGPPEQYTVTELPVPRPGPGQIQVRIAAAAINPADVRLPSGEFGDAVRLEFPYVPGNDFAGTVTEVGAGVNAYRAGDEVFGLAMPRVLRAMAGRRPSVGTGSLAEYAVVEADTPLVAHRPAALSAEDAAALATAGLTARAIATTANLQPGEHVLVVGASGGVGTALIPLLAAAKAHVTATATDVDAELLRRLGAAEIIGYQEADYPAGIDVAVNAVLPGDRLTGLAAALRPGGRLTTITYPVPTPELIGRDDVGLDFVLDVDGDLGGMREVGDAAMRGELRATIGRRYRLGQGPQACTDFVREHTTGKLVVTM